MTQSRDAAEPADTSPAHAQGSQSTEGTTIHADDFTDHPDLIQGSQPPPEVHRETRAWGPDDRENPREDRRLITAKIARVARRLRELDTGVPGVMGGPPSDPAWLASLTGLFLDEGLWLDQVVSSHELRDRLSIVTIDFRWIDIESGASIGPSTFIGYGLDETDHGVERALAATVRTYLRHTFLNGIGGTGRAPDAMGRVGPDTSPRLVTDPGGASDLTRPPVEPGSSAEIAPPQTGALRRGRPGVTEVQAIRVRVTAIACPPASATGYGLGHDENGRIVEFYGETRAMQHIGEALDAQGEDGEPVRADVPLSCVLDIRGEMEPAASPTRLD